MCLCVWRFMSSLSVVAESSELLKAIVVTQEFCAQGVYQLRLCKDGQWTTVIVDDVFPCDAFGRLLYSQVRIMTRRHCRLMEIRAVAILVCLCFQKIFLCLSVKWWPKMIIPKTRDVFKDSLFEVEADASQTSSRLSQVHTYYNTVIMLGQLAKSTYWKKNLIEIGK